MTAKIEVRLCKEDLVDWITGNGQATVEEVGGDDVINDCIDQIVGIIQQHMGDEFEVWATPHICQDRIGTQPASCSEHTELLHESYEIAGRAIGIY